MSQASTCGQVLAKAQGPNSKCLNSGSQMLMLKPKTSARLPLTKFERKNEGSNSKAGSVASKLAYGGHRVLAPC